MRLGALRPRTFGTHLRATRSLMRLLAGVEPASNKDGQQVPRAVRRGEPSLGTNTGQQFAGGEPQFAAAHLLHAAPPSGRSVSELGAVLPEPSAFHAQPACRA